MPRSLLPAVLVALLISSVALAAAPPSAPDTTRMTVEEFEASLQYRDGEVSLKDGLATLRLTPAFHYLDAEDAARVLVAWGNPPEIARGTLGLICPAARGVTADSAWVVVISYAEDGHVSDKDAEKIDYDKLLKGMQEATRKANERRVKEGFSAMELVGWAEPPHYDRETHKLYWAKELQFGGENPPTLNYGTRVLGRRGVLELNAVADMVQLPAIRTSMADVLPMVDFTTGNRYADYVKGQDKAAEYGLAALITGGAVVAAKAGVFKGLLAVLLAFKKFIILGLAGVGAWLRSVLGKKKADGPIEERPTE